MLIRTKGLPPHPCIPSPVLGLPPCPRPFSGHRLLGSGRVWPAEPYPWSASRPGCSSSLRPCSPGAGNAGSLLPSAALLPPPPSVGTGQPRLTSHSLQARAGPDSRGPSHQDGRGGFCLAETHPPSTPKSITQKNIIAFAQSKA